MLGSRRGGGFSETARSWPGPGLQPARARCLTL